MRISSRVLATARGVRRVSLFWKFSERSGARADMNDNKPRWHASLEVEGEKGLERAARISCESLLPTPPFQRSERALGRKCVDNCEDGGYGVMRFVVMGRGG